MRSMVLLCLLASAPLLCAQRLPEQKPTFQGTLLLPTQLRNPVFGRLTAPLGEVEGSFQLPLVKGLGVGVGASFMFWDLQQRAFPLLSTIGEARRSVYFGKLQYARYTGEKTFYELNAKAGPARWTWDCSTCVDNVEQRGLHWGVNAGYYVHATRNLAFGVTVGYERDDAEFNAGVICEPNFPGYPEVREPYRFFTVGLGFSTRFEPSEEERW